MALLFLEEDPWILEHESCEKLQREIMGQLTERQKFPRTHSLYAQISADIRLRLKQFNNEVDQLKQKLDASSGSNAMYPFRETAAESERRVRQIEVLLTKALQMQKLFNEQLTEKRMEERQTLLGPRSIDWDEYSSGTSRVSVDNMRAKQQEMLSDQEKGLENLSKIISRQKDIAHTIANEVDFHNEIIGDIGIQIDRTDQRVRVETERVGTVGRKDNTCGYWIVIIILLVSIIVVAAL
ncbi:hypothetical protein HUJ05_004671 [Dendroctonus ponderosae]|nr:hypothetical protein HUJ05_004671 [Dendroctonus ponderosae]